MIEVTLEYRRVGSTMLSAGRVTLKKDDGPLHERHTFENYEYKSMMRLLSSVLMHLAPEETVRVIIQRTDRVGLVPYVLDDATVALLRTDPVAGLQALTVTSPSPAQVLADIKKNWQPPRQPLTLRAGADTLADAFGETVAFKVRGHELECPGCGFWGMYTAPTLLNDPDRVGAVFKTVFICPKKCRQRFIVSCHKAWGFVSVADLLASPREAFYLPRAWNSHRPWISRADLQQRYTEYLKEKENAL